MQAPAKTHSRSGEVKNSPSTGDHVWYFVRGKKGDAENLPKVLDAAAKVARKVGTDRAVAILDLNVRPRRKVDPTTASTTPAQDDYRDHEARRWVALRNEFFVHNDCVSAPELARLTGSKAINPSARGHDWSKANRVFSVDDGVAERYPVFQLREGKPIPQVAAVLRLLRPRLSNWQVAFWFASPNAWLGNWKTPVEVLAEEPDKVVDAARHEVAEHVL